MFALGHSIALVPIFRYLLQVTHDEELLSEEGAKLWIECRSSGDASPHEPSISSSVLELFSNPLVQDFVNWICAEDSEEDEEEEEEEVEEKIEEEDNNDL